MADGNMPKNRRSARALGLQHYVTGKLCKHGHASERRVSDGHCLECNRVADKARRPRREKLRAEKHPRRMAERNKRWREKNHEKVVAYNAMRTATGYLVEWRKKNLERLRALEVEWRKANPDTVRANKNRRRARKLAAEGTHSRGDLVRIRKDQRDRCAACREKLRGGGEADHILALVNGGSNWPSNIQFLCQSCNRSKKDRDPIIFMRGMGKLL